MDVHSNKQERQRKIKAATTRKVVEAVLITPKEMNRSRSIWQARRGGEEEEETAEQRAASAAEFWLGVRRRDALRGLRSVADAVELAFDKFRVVFPGPMDVVGHQEEVEETTQTVERVALPLRAAMRKITAVEAARQVVAGPPVPSVAAMPSDAGEGLAEIVVEEDGDGVQGQVRSTAGVRGGKRGRAVKEEWQVKARVVEVTGGEEERCELLGYEQSLPSEWCADHVLPPNWEGMEESDSVCLNVMAKYPKYFERGEEVIPDRGTSRCVHLLTWGTAVLAEPPRKVLKRSSLEGRADRYVRGYVVTEGEKFVRVVLDDGSSFSKSKDNVYWCSLALHHGEFEAVEALTAEYRACREHQVAEGSDVVWLPREDAASNDGACAAAGVEEADGEGGATEGESRGGDVDGILARLAPIAARLSENVRNMH